MPGAPFDLVNVRLVGIVINAEAWVPFLQRLSTILSKLSGDDPADGKDPCILTLHEIFLSCSYCSSFLISFPFLRSLEVSSN